MSSRRWAGNPLYRPLAILRGSACPRILACQYGRVNRQSGPSIRAEIGRTRPGQAREEDPKNYQRNLEVGEWRDRKLLAWSGAAW
jgi:hypothetical protein